MKKKINNAIFERSIKELREYSDKQYKNFMMAEHFIRKMRLEDTKDAFKLLAEINNFDKRELRQLKRVTKQYRKADNLANKATKAQQASDATGDAVSKLAFVEQ